MACMSAADEWCTIRVSPHSGNAVRSRRSPCVDSPPVTRCESSLIPNLYFLPQEIVRRARSRLGENDYRLLTNNCEHFCNWCLDGVSHSAQVERPLVLPFRVLGALFHT